MKTLALFGTCGHQNGVLDELAARNDFRFVGTAPVTAEDDATGALARNAWTRQGRLYASPEALLEAETPDIVLVAPRFDQVARISKLSVEAGCHVLSEKPLSISLDELDALWEAVERMGVQCGSLLANREQPVLAAARALIARGDLGEVVLLNARKSYRWGERPLWYGDRKLYGGTIPWIGIHALDFMYAVTERRFLSVSARHTNAGHPERPQCEDACVMQLELEGGTLATASLDYFRPACAPSHGDDWLRVVGTKGVLEAAMEGGVCHVIAPGYETHNEAPPIHGLAGFAPWLNTLTPRAIPSAPDNTTRRAFLLTHAALCARNAADQHSCINIPIKPWG